MLKNFYPDEIRDGVYVINFDEYYDNGIRGIIFDIDNTLTPHGADADPKAEELFLKLARTGFKVCLISNNKERRVKPFAKAVNAPYIYDAGKPGTKSYIRAMDIMNTDRKNTIFVGDQIFTDIYGAKRAGIYSVLTRPINKKEEIQIVMKRYFEKIILYFYGKQRKSR